VLPCLTGTDSAESSYLHYCSVSRRCGVPYTSTLSAQHDQTHLRMDVRLHKQRSVILPTTVGVRGATVDVVPMGSTSRARRAQKAETNGHHAHCKTDSTHYLAQYHTLNVLLHVLILVSTYLVGWLCRQAVCVVRPAPVQLMLGVPFERSSDQLYPQTYDHTFTSQMSMSTCNARTLHCCRCTCYDQTPLSKICLAVHLQETL